MRTSQGMLLVLASVVGLTLALEPVAAGSALRRDPTQERPWRAEGDQEGSHFGGSVGTAGDVNGDGYADVIVGAAYFDNGQVDEGRAFVYHGSATGPSATPDWTAEPDDVGAWFGSGVGLAGDVNADGYDDVIVGSAHFGDVVEDGGTFVYYGSADGLSPTPNWSVLGARVGRGAGDVNGDGYSDVIVANRGDAVAYHGSADGLSLTPDWIADGSDDEWIASVGAAGDVDGDGYGDVIVGAPQTQHGELWEGAAHLYVGSPNGLRARASWKQDGDVIVGLFGQDVGTVGDVNGDGFDDFAVTHRDYRDFGDAALVFHGSPTGPRSRPDWAAAGWTIGAAGDLNRDGFDDVVVGGLGQDDQGAVLVFAGSPGGLGRDPILVIEETEKNGTLGYSVGTAGDVNADGSPDILVGDPYYTNDQDDEGAAFVYRLA
jgi:hypothetical protein